MWRIATHLVFFYRIGSTIEVKNVQLGCNESTFMPIFSAYVLGFFSQ